ncbi:hypothetical protein B0E38_01856 [Streptomyces sp. 111WW2]|nr:hypothetical protein B0E38_01856 [Streptomyces sp. 111WW2]
MLQEQEQETVDRINAMLAEMPDPVAQQLVQQLAADRMRDEPPVSLVPPATFPYGRGLGGTVARWSCRTGCGWGYEEDADPGMPGPFTLPADFTPDDVSAAISAQATARHEAQLDRVQAAFAGHYRTVHPELLEDTDGVPSPAAR